MHGSGFVGLGLQALSVHARLSFSCKSVESAPELERILWMHNVGAKAIWHTHPPSNGALDS